MENGWEFSHPFSLFNNISTHNFRIVCVMEITGIFAAAIVAISDFLRQTCFVLLVLKQNLALQRQRQFTESGEPLCSGGSNDSTNVRRSSWDA